MGVGGQRDAPAAFTPGKDPVLTVQEAGLVWMGVENLAPTRIRSLDHPAQSKSLYRQSYAGPLTPLCTSNITHKQKYLHGEQIILELATRNNLEVHTPIDILMIYFSWVTVGIQLQQHQRQYGNQ